MAAYETVASSTVGRLMAWFCFFAALLALAHGEAVLVVGGFFTSADSVRANMVAEWRGNHSSGVGQWHVMGSGVNYVVKSISDFKGNVVVGGLFTESGSTSTVGVAQWDGMEWSSIGSGVMRDGYFPQVNTISVSSNTTLFVGGLIDFAGQLGGKSSTHNNAVTWDGLSWFAMGPDPGSPKSSAVYQSSLYIGCDGLKKRSGSNWTLEALTCTSPDGYGSIYAITSYYNDLVISGTFSAVCTPSTCSNPCNPILCPCNGVSASRIARWNGASWSPFASGTDNTILALAFHRGNLVAGGQFTMAGGLLSNYIAQWNGAAWVPLGSGMNDFVWALSNFGNSLVAGGMFTTAGGVAARGIALWTDAVWKSLGDGVNGVVYALHSHELPMPPPTPTSTVPPTLPPGGECPSFVDYEWRSQYHFDEDRLVLVEEVLAFENDAFMQNITSFGYQECEWNWVHWTGNFAMSSGSSILFSFVRCTQSGAGCVKCSPSYDDLTSVAFSKECDTMTLTLTQGTGVPRTYYIQNS